MPRPRARTRARARRSAPAPRPRRPAPTVEERALPVVREVARVGTQAAVAPDRLKTAFALVLDSWGAEESGLPKALLAGWARAREDKQQRLAMAWLTEQLRLGFEEILTAGIRRGELRGDIHPPTLAALFVAVAHGCLLPPPGARGPVEPPALAAALIRLVSEA